MDLYRQVLDTQNQKDYRMVSHSIKTNILPLILLSFIILGIFYLYWSYVSTIILAGTLAVVLYSPYRRVCNYVSETKAATIVIAITVVILLIISFFIISVFISSSEYLGQMSETIIRWLNHLPDLGFVNVYITLQLNSVSV